MTTPIEIGATPLTLLQLRAALDGPVTVSLTQTSWGHVEKGAATVEAILKEGRTVYGINTGFGLLANTSIAADDLETLQKNLVLSHACGVGAPLSEDITRLLMVLKIASLSKGASGIRRRTLETLIGMVNAEVLPLIPSKGSVGASGDLAPLAHMSSVLIGVGEARYQGQIMEATEALSKAGLEPIVLGPKEGLALLNGTQCSTALALAGLFATEDVFAAAIAAGGLSTDALKGSDAPFDHRIHALRGQPGQIDVAKRLREILSGSAIRESHRHDCSKVQDPYSLRCQPQVMGATLDVLRNAAAMLEREANAVTDNPLVFIDDGEVISGGNFHAEPVAYAADQIAMVLCEIGNISERRTSILVDPKMSELPAFLVKESGLNSGFMIAQVTAAALVAENRMMAHPCVIDTVPTSANQEDHVSMATHGARRLLDMAENTANVVGIELLAAAQGIDFHRPLTSSPELEQAYAIVREAAAPYTSDHYFAPDIARATQGVRAGRYRVFAADLLPSA
ncbi:MULTISPECIES: histidine ammonia-lyase [unclassified Brevundimonas]|uniref:histidine ammonia-lyase n=1 Tax=unclassified Brevundimonas TaxID=2622653 RepID=UPI0025C2DE61|nr:MULTISPECIES: histidine ammonia-lyase [unclassified Brevundimonas]